MTFMFRTRQLPSTDTMGYSPGEYDYGYNMWKAQCEWLEKSDEMQFIEVWTSQVQAATSFSKCYVFLRFQLLLCSFGVLMNRASLGRGAICDQRRESIRCGH